MPNKRFKYHPYLSDKFLKRGNGNYCCNCGKRMKNIKPGIGNAYEYWIMPDDSDKIIFIGYAHRICPDSRGKSDDIMFV